MSIQRNGGGDSYAISVGAGGFAHAVALVDSEGAVLQNSAASVLASAARTATTNSADIANLGWRGVQVVINATANPGGGETLALSVQGKDVVSGSYYDIAASGTVLTAGNGIKALTVYPGVLAADGATGNTQKSAAVPATFRVVVTHSSSGSWVYSVSIVGLV